MNSPLTVGQVLLLTFGVLIVFGKIMREVNRRKS